MRRSIQWLIGLGFAITIPLSMVTLYIIFFVVRHHMFIYRWSK